jgi:hypothetical protein
MICQSATSVQIIAFQKWGSLARTDTSIATSYSTPITTLNFQNMSGKDPSNEHYGDSARFEMTKGEIAV